MVRGHEGVGVGGGELILEFLDLVRADRDSLVLEDFAHELANLESQIVECLPARGGQGVVLANLAGDDPLVLLQESAVFETMEQWYSVPGDRLYPWAVSVSFRATPYTGDRLAW